MSPTSERTVSVASLTEERGGPLRRWLHRLTVEATRCFYRDEVVLDAGPTTRWARLARAWS